MIVTKINFSKIPTATLEYEGQQYLGFKGYARNLHLQAHLQTGQRVILITAEGFEVPAEYNQEKDELKFLGPLVKNA